MNKRLIFLFLFVIAIVYSVGVFSFPVSVLAEDCRCFCESSEGVTKPKLQNDEVACQKYCNKEGSKMVSCSTGYSQEPSSNPLCFDADQCKAQGGILKGEQRPECVKGSKYCYPDPKLQKKITLQLSVEGVSEVSGLADYINVFYSWMMKAGFIIAIVFVMIGGLQYVISAGGGDVGAAKKRINNAIIGLILLSSVHLILFLVNPELVKLQVPQLPMLRKLSLVQSASCESLIEKSYEVVPQKKGQTTCSNTGDVLTDPKGNATAGGMTCQYMGGCNLSIKEKCVGVGDRAKCASCEQVYEGNEKGLKPSESLCESASLDTVGKGKTAVYQTCGWTKDGDLSPGWSGLLKAADTGSCARINLTCTPTFKCSDYNNVKVENSKKNSPLSGIKNNTDSRWDKTACYGSCGNFSVEQYCTKNTCLVDGGCEIYNDKCMAPEEVKQKKIQESNIEKAKQEAFTDFSQQGANK